MPRWSMEMREGGKAWRRAARGRRRRRRALGVPAGDGVGAGGEGDDVIDAVDPATEDVEAHRPHAEGVEAQDFGIGHVVGQLGDADPVGAEAGEDVGEVGLVVGLEGAGDDGAGGDAEGAGHGRDRRRAGSGAGCSPGWRRRGSGGR
jgi:hypothetical protein